jgi:hypothetical protein
MIVSVIFYVDGARAGTDPFGKENMGGPDEQRYYRYAVARFAAFSNVMWDVANEYRLFRDDAWAEKMGSLIKEYDPYDHLTSTHGHETFNFRHSSWADFAMYQAWDEHGGHGFMLFNAREQEKVGRDIPQVNEEYGYEDHYPQGWGENRKPPARSAETRRKIAWGIYMAGCYQTTGERANTGTGSPPDTGGGWINGRGDDTMTMLSGYAHIVEFFSEFPYWKCDPHDELATGGAMCLFARGECYAVYLPEGGVTTLNLQDDYTVRQFNPSNGQWKSLGQATGQWTSPEIPKGTDAAFLIQRQK